MSGNEQPWIKGDLHLPAALLTQIHEHALETYPSECCGFIAGPIDAPQQLSKVVREVNEADKFHKLDPETFPRTSNTYFKINELRAARAFEHGDKTGEPIKIIYHSHCDAGAYFSTEDAATFASDNLLMWPCAFVVVSVLEGRIADTKLWVHRAGTNEFRESTLHVQ
jgi:proteasome lid subunit RPN8/RPN11